MISGAGLLVLLSSVFAHFAAESSPVARGTATPGMYTCLQCHSKNDANASDNWSPATCNSEPIARGHSDYEGDCEDLQAFFAMVRVRNSFAERVASNTANRLLEGERLARKFYCFQCHGELGQGGYPNAGSLKGYVPGYFGNDFAKLTNNASPAAVKAWISDGTNPDLLDRLLTGPIAAFFIARQAIQMPRLDSLSDSELDLLASYVIKLHESGPMDAAAVRKYERLTRVPVSTSKQHPTEIPAR